MAKSIENIAASGTNQVSDDQLRAYIRIEVENRKKCAAANSARNTARKQFKAAGVMLGEFDEIISMLDRPRQEVRESFAVRERYARMMNLPVGTQADLFDADGGHKDVSDENGGDIAFAKGYQDGVLGKSAEVPEQYLDHNQQWMKGWKAGQDSIAMDLISKKTS